MFRLFAVSMTLCFVFIMNFIYADAYRVSKEKDNHLGQHQLKHEHHQKLEPKDEAFISILDLDTRSTETLMDATSTQAKNHKSETESTFPNGDTIVFTPKSDELSEVEKKFKEAFDEANNEFINAASTKEENYDYALNPYQTIVIFDQNQIAVYVSWIEIEKKLRLTEEFGKSLKNVSDNLLRLNRFCINHIRPQETHKQPSASFTNMKGKAIPYSYYFKMITQLES